MHICSVHKCSRSFYPPSLGGNVHFLKITPTSIFGSCFSEPCPCSLRSGDKNTIERCRSGHRVYFIMLWEYKFISLPLTDGFFPSVLFFYTRASEEKWQNSSSNHWKVTKKKCSFSSPRRREERWSDGEMWLLLVNSPQSLSPTDQLQKHLDGLLVAPAVSSDWSQKI